MILASALMLLQAATTYPLDARGQVRQLDDPLALPARVAVICAAQAAEPTSQLARDEDALSRALMPRARTARWDSLATDLACVRGVEATRRVMAQEGYLMPLGTPLKNGAAAILSQVVADHLAEHRLADTRSERLLAVLAPSLVWTDSIVPGQGQAGGVPAQPFADLLFTAVRDGVMDSGVFRGCASLALDAADYMTARECSSRALEHGADSTWHLLRLAYIAFHTADTLLGTRLFQDAGAVASDAQARSDYGWHLDLRARPLMTSGMFRGRMRYVTDSLHPPELAAFVADSDSLSRSAYLRTRVQKLTEAGHAPLGALLATHFNSITYARGTFHDCNRLSIHLALASNFGVQKMTSKEKIDAPKAPNGTGALAPCFSTLEPDLHVIGFSANRYRIWEPATGRPLTVVTYAIPLAALVMLDDSAGPTATFDIDFRERDATTQQWNDSTETFRSRVPANRRAGSLQGMLVLPRSAGASEWTISAVQSSNRRGILDEDVAPLGNAPLELSDIVVGDPDQRVVWRLADDSIVLAPLGAVSQRALLELFVQLRAPAAQPRVRFTLSVYRISDGQPASRPVLQVASTGPVKAGISGIHRELDVARLGRGQYQLRLQVATDSATVERTARVTVR